MAFSGCGLVFASPVGPAEDVFCGCRRPCGQGIEEAADLVEGERDHPGRRRGPVTFIGSDDRQEAIASIARVTQRCQDFQVRT